MASTSKSTTIGLIIYRHSTRTKLRQLAGEKTEGKLPNPCGNTRKSWAHLPSSFFWLTPETKRKNLRFTQCSHFVQLHQEQEEELIYWIDNANTCFNRRWCFYLNEITTSAELFIKCFFFLWSPHFFAFEPPNNNPPKTYIQFHRPPILSPTPTPSNKSRRNMSPILGN